MNYAGKTVLIAGGTRGIGLASAVEFAKQGASVWITHYWGSTSETEIYEYFEKNGVTTKPHIFRANITQTEDTTALLTEIRKHTERIDAFICCAGMLKRIESMEDYSKRAFLKTMEYMAWPMIDYTLLMKEIFGSYPKYIVGMTTYSTIAFNNNYDFAAAAKASVEVLVRYMAVRLASENVRINMLRPPMVDTQALSVFGDQHVQKMKALMPVGMQMRPEEVGRAVYGLCSGYLDTINGQIINLDNGATFIDNTPGLIERPDYADILAKLSALR